MCMPESITVYVCVMYCMCAVNPLCVHLHAQWSVCVCVCVFSYLSQLAVLHTEPQALSVGQGVAPLGCGSLAGRGRGAVAHRPPSRYHHLAAGLVLIQRTLAGIYDPARARHMRVNLHFTSSTATQRSYYIKHLATFFQVSFFSQLRF